MNSLGNKKDVLQPVDEQAIALGRSLLRSARFGALATLDPASGVPLASRVALATETDGSPLILISTLAAHTDALTADPRCSLLVGEPGKGDPLAHPRMTVVCRAQWLKRDDEDGKQARRRYLNRHAKAVLYADFGDFCFLRLKVVSASLNGGFARAYALEREHLILPAEASENIAGAEQSALDHMNEDHADAIDRIAGAAESGAKNGWSLTGIDPEGIDLAQGDVARRVLFKQMLQSPNEIRSALVDLTKSASKPAQ